MKLCTVILEYQNPTMTLETIKSLKQASVPAGFSHEIIVVDNSPVPDGSLKRAVRNLKKLKLITTLKNTGFAKGNNIGIKYGQRKKADFFLLLNNDVLVDKKFLLYLIKAAKNKADLITPKIYFAKGYEFHKNRYQPQELGRVIWYAGAEFDWNNVYSRHIGMNEVDNGQFNQAKEVELANFCCVLIKKEVFQKIGLLDEKYFLYWEDGDFSVRARKAGLKLLFEPKSVIWHKNSGSSGTGSTLHDYYLTRNRLVFGYKYARLRTKFALLKQSLFQIFTGRPGERKGAMDFYFNRLGKGKTL